uniref:Nuclear receptor domain-containing protein n=1 Tax=Macrostomum lignano TaxID=282301 RepID=A0A1I8JMD9_9PLAT
MHITKSGVVHRKKCRHPKTPADLMRRYCLVCGCKAENYNFGVISCESCKAFFRRNAHKQTLGEAGFACSFRRGGCEVSLATRKKCPGCRLAKCFAVGMQADLIQKADQVYQPSAKSPSSSASVPLPTMMSVGSSSSSVSSFASAIRRPTPLPPPPPPPPPLQPARLPDAARDSDQSEHLLRLWHRLQSPEPKLPPSSFTEPNCNEASGAEDHRYANVLLVDFFVELRKLVADTMLCDIQAANDTGVAMLEAFVHQVARFIAGLRQVDQLEKPHFLALLRCRLHSVLFRCCPALATARMIGSSTSPSGAVRSAVTPFSSLSIWCAAPAAHLVDYTPLVECDTYISLLARGHGQCGRNSSHCSALPSCCLRYHQHLVDSLYYHYPFEFDQKLEACLPPVQMVALGFDRTLHSFIQYCPLTAGILEIGTRACFQTAAASFIPVYPPGVQQRVSFVGHGNASRQQERLGGNDWRPLPKRTTKTTEEVVSEGREFELEVMIAEPAYRGEGAWAARLSSAGCSAWQLLAKIGDDNLASQRLFTGPGLARSRLADRQPVFRAGHLPQSEGGCAPDTPRLGWRAAPARGCPLLPPAISA